MTSLRQVLERAQSASTAVGHFAWRRGLEQGLSELPNEVAPYKILRPAVESVGQVAMERLRLFAGVEMAAVRDPVPG
jgi:hypothetical protein